MTDTPKIASDCAICCDEITKDTGRSVMSCGHEFHMRCIVQWLQKPDGTGNCPCCRAEPSNQERLVTPPEYDAESDYDYDYDYGPEEAMNVSGITPLMSAVSDGRLTEVQRMIAEGVNLEDKDSNGETALVYASGNSEDACVTALLEAGADITAMARRNGEGGDMIIYNVGAALLGSCLFKSLPCVLDALNKGANPNYMHPVSGRTPLMYALQVNADITIVDALLDKGASVEAVDNKGMTVFMWFSVGSYDSDDIMESLRRPRACEEKHIDCWFMGRMMTTV